jgi:hypothetical protein
LDEGPPPAAVVVVVTTLDEGPPTPSSSLVVVAIIVDFSNRIRFVLCGTNNILCRFSKVDNMNFLGVDTSFVNMGGKYLSGTFPTESVLAHTREQKERQAKDN